MAFFKSYFPQIEMKSKIMALAYKVTASARAKERNNRICRSQYIVSKTAEQANIFQL
jgi:hypothetical protein